MPRIRTLPKDFVVEEIASYDPSGGGPFALLWIEKVLANTDDVARSLAEQLGVLPKHIGYAGRKDHRAVARQWLSAPAAKDRDLTALELPGTRILKVERHDQKLRLGDLTGNRFRLRVLEVDDADAERAASRLADVQQQGMPNRFGKQRFGRDGRNAERGREILETGRFRGRRQQAWLMISALQSLVFNQVLERRRDQLDELWPGDVAFDHRTRDLLWVSDAEEAQRRAAAFEWSATGPIFGSKMKSPRGRARQLEQEVLEGLGLGNFDRFKVPRSLRLFGDRRPLRSQVKECQSEYDAAAQCLSLSFVLPPGSYATVLLDELFPEGFEEGPKDRPQRSP